MRKKFLTPFFVSALASWERFSARIRVCNAECAWMMIFETVLFPLGEGWNKRGHRTACPDSGSGLFLNDSYFQEKCSVSTYFAFQVKAFTGWNSASASVTQPYFFF